MELPSLRQGRLWEKFFLGARERRKVGGLYLQFSSEDIKSLLIPVCP